MDLQRVLNPRQLEAVQHTTGPLLILAGAGSGKTRVITHRIVYLHKVDHVPLHRILAVTFTNKAADEMRHRVGAILAEHGGADGPGQCWLSTFHSFCARLLRMYAERLDLNPRFTIADDRDQKLVIARAIKALDLDVAPETRRGYARVIDDAKNRGLDPDALDQLAIGAKAEQEAAVYRAYQAELRRNDALDFGDLLMEAVRLLQTRPRVKAQCQRRWTHLMVDEFQDTNPVQYKLLRLLTGPDENLAVVGDDDQSIYRWRGATVRNILDFEADYPAARVVVLEQNYRSTQRILDAATAVVEKIHARRDKRLWTDQEGGEPITVFTGHHAREEASFVARQIQRLAMRGEADYGECAVFYRTNAQSRLIEEEFRAKGLPYQVVGGVSFYSRSEVKDVLAYLKVALNPNDGINLLRVINTPRRGIGDKTVERLEDFARSLGPSASLYEALSLIAEGDVEPDGIRSRQRSALCELHTLLSELRADVVEGLAPSLIASRVIERTDFSDWLDKNDPATAEDRKQNIWELIAAMADFERDGGGGLVEFLERSALVQQADTVEADPDVHITRSRPITLMTVHAAKGLEFDAVFVVGLEEGLFPLIRERDRNAPDVEEKLEEERRLFYVAMTRARRYLTLANARTRRIYGKDTPSQPSTFLLDLPSDAWEVDKASCERTLAWGTRSKKRRRHDQEMEAAARFDEFDQSPEAIYAPPPVVKATYPSSEPWDEFDQRTIEYDDEWGPAAAEPSAIAGDDGLVGRTVSHTREGFGTVTSVSGSGDMASLTVLFVNSGRELTVKRKFLKIPEDRPDQEPPYMHRVYLIPGFFGFANIGGLTYFHHVEQLLKEALRERGVDATIFAVMTHPTASIPKRAVRLAELLEGTTRYDDHPIHLVGHSTGGLDARLFVSPGVRLKTEIDVRRLVKRVETVTTVATPHFGTPMASFFSSRAGQKALLVLSLMTIYSLRFGKAPLGVIKRLGAMFTRADDIVGLDNTVLDQLYDTLLDDFSSDRRKGVNDFLNELKNDQSLIPQLTEEGIELFNTSTGDNDDVRYGCVITRASRPGLRSALELGLDPYAQLTHALFSGLYWLTDNANVPGPDVLTLERTQRLMDVYGERPDENSSDGVVPTLSQIWGEIIHVTLADHLDAVGHFNAPDHTPPHVDWLATGSNFTRDKFDALWSDVADFIAGPIEE